MSPSSWSTTRWTSSCTTCHPHGRQRRRPPHRHRCKRRTHRLARRPQPATAGLARPTAGQQTAAEGLQAVRARRGATGSSRWQYRPEYPLPPRPQRRPGLTLDSAQAAVAPLALDSPDGRKLVRLERLELSETTLDLARRQVSIGKLRSRHLETWAAREADGELDWRSCSPRARARRMLTSRPRTAKPRQPANRGRSCCTMPSCAITACTWPIACRTTRSSSSSAR